MDFSIQVLSSGSWPFQQSCTFALPSEVSLSSLLPLCMYLQSSLSSSELSLSVCVQLERSYQRFTAFYASRHSGRKLTWLYHLSKGELVTNCFKNRRVPQSNINPSSVCQRVVMVIKTSRRDQRAVLLLLFPGTHCRPPPSRWPSCCSTTRRTATPSNS